MAGLLQVYPFGNPLPQDTVPNHPSVPVQFMKTRMHSSRMRTVCSSWGKRGGRSAHAGIHPWVCACRAPLGVCLETPRGQTPQPPSWAWAWRLPGQTPQLTPPLGVGLKTPPQLDPSTSHLCVGLETCKACWDTTPLLWTEFLTHAFKNITLPQLRFLTVQLSDINHENSNTFERKTTVLPTDPPITSPF